jgi:hypothetical protein
MKEKQRKKKGEEASSNFDPLYMRDIRAVEKNEEKKNEMPKNST